VKIGYLILAFCLVSFGPFVFAGSKSSLLTEKKVDFSSYEKVFVKTDKDIYWNGEKLFYKAWVLDAQTLKNTSSSSWLYFELVNIEGKICMSWKVNAVNGVVSGITYINDTIQSGVYVLRAFTNLMRNMPEKYYYSTNILVLKLSSPEITRLEVPVYPENTEDNLLCQPGGGRLVAGIPNTLYYNFNNTNKSFNAQLVDNRDSVVSNFFIDSSGIGSISFVPSIDLSYHVNIDDPIIGKIKSKPMAVFADGFIGSFNRFGEKAYFRYSTNDATLKNGKYNFHIFLRDKKLLDTAIVAKPADSLVFNLKGSAGIVQVVITNSKNDTVFEQLYYCASKTNKPVVEFVQAQNEPNIKVALNLLNPALTDTLNLAFTVSYQHPFSILNINHSLNRYIQIQSDLGLSLQAFNADSLSIENINCLLALIKGDQYYWNIVRNKKVFSNQRYFSPENKGFYLSAQLVDGFTKQPASNKIVTMSYVDSIPNVQYAVTDTMGYCHFLLNDDAENKELILQLFKNDKDDKHIYSIIVEPKGGLKTSFKKANLMLNSEQTKYIDKIRKLRLVEKIFTNQEVKNSEKQTNELQENFRLNVKNMIKYSVFPQDYTELENMADIINNILPGVFLKEKDNTETLNVFDPNLRAVMPNQASIFLNGVLVDDLDFILKLKYTDIYKIDVCQTQLFYGDLSFHGFISIITNDLAIPSSFYSSTRIKVENFVAQSQCVNKFTKEEIDQMKKEGIPDFRNILYLNYSKIPFNHGISNPISIFPSNFKGMYNFSIQGFTKDGEIFENSVQFKIQ